MHRLLSLAPVQRGGQEEPPIFPRESSASILGLHCWVEPPAVPLGVQRFLGAEALVIRINGDLRVSPWSVSYAEWQDTLERTAPGPSLDDSEQGVSSWQCTGGIAASGI